MRWRWRRCCSRRATAAWLRWTLPLLRSPVRTTPRPVLFRLSTRESRKTVVKPFDWSAVPSFGFVGQTQLATISVMTTFSLILSCLVCFSLSLSLSSLSPQAAAEARSVTQALPSLERLMGLIEGSATARAALVQPPGSRVEGALVPAIHRSASTQGGRPAPPPAGQARHPANRFLQDVGIQPCVNGVGWAQQESQEGGEIRGGRADLACSSCIVRLSVLSVCLLCLFCLSV